MRVLEEDWDFEGSGDSVLFDLDTKDERHAAPRSRPGGDPRVRFSPAPMPAVQSPTDASAPSFSSMPTLPRPRSLRPVSIIPSRATLDGVVNPGSGFPGSRPSNEPRPFYMPSLPPIVPVASGEPIDLIILSPQSRPTLVSGAGTDGSGIVAFAGYPSPPVALGDTPRYALRVLARRRVLRAQLLLARRHRSADIGLYETALTSADEGAVRKGLALIGGAIALGLSAVAALATLV
jgi:hypothetical protein